MPAALDFTVSLGVLGGSFLGGGDLFCGLLCFGLLGGRGLDDGLGLALSLPEDLGLADLDPLDGDDDVACLGGVLCQVAGDDRLDDVCGRRWTWS